MPASAPIEPSSASQCERAGPRSCASSGGSVVAAMARAYALRVRDDARMTALPPAIDALADQLAAMPGVVAVALGGSRASGVADARSDWDLGVYYRGAIDTAALAA